MAIKIVDAATAKQWLAHNEAILIDVREPAEYATEYISGGRSVPLGQVSPATVPEAGQRPVIIHCLKGGRGMAACQKLATERPEAELYNLEGGITAWRDAGFATITPPGRAPGLPLDRQVQLTIGLGLLLSSALALLVHPGFVLLAAVFGTGLTIAGATGFCGLARVMAVMPWNRVTK